jgi:hypothetical protein
MSTPKMFQEFSGNLSRRNVTKNKKMLNFDPRQPRKFLKHTTIDFREEPTHSAVFSFISTVDRDRPSPNPNSQIISPIHTQSVFISWKALFRLSVSEIATARPTSPI